MVINERETRLLEASVAVVVPCLNEEITIGKVVRDFQASLPGAVIYVFDNGSTDRTAAVAREAGAIVVPSPRRGKGHVVRHMFDVVDADLYIMADGDDTYPADAAKELIEAHFDTGADMVVATRLKQHHEGAFRRFHTLGNGLVAFLISALFGAKVTDALSGYRVFTRRLVKGLPLRSDGFTIETELTLKTLARGMGIHEVPVPYGVRPAGSFSKLSTYRDGARVLSAIALLFKDYKPLALFGTLAVLTALASLAAGLVPIVDYVQTGFVEHVPLAILSAGLGIVATVTLSVGLVLDTLAAYHMDTSAVLERVAGTPMSAPTRVSSRHGQ